MSRPVIVRPEADRDVLESRDWYEERLEGLGFRFASHDATAIERLGELPELFGEVGPGVRAAPVKRFKHIVYYRVLPDRLDVLAVLHSARDPSEWQKRIRNEFDANPAGIVRASPSARQDCDSPFLMPVR